MEITPIHCTLAAWTGQRAREAAGRARQRTSVRRGCGGPPAQAGVLWTPARSLAQRAARAGSLRPRPTAAHGTRTNERRERGPCPFLDKGAAHRPAKAWSQTMPARILAPVRLTDLPRIAEGTRARRRTRWLISRGGSS